ncbi:hypothetical protein HW555_010977, partial [Spodoptera exigua]
GISPSLNLTSSSNELAVFEKFVDEELIKTIIRYTNLYHCYFILNTDLRNHSRLLTWKDVTVPEMYIFLPITMLMTRNSRLTIEEHWSTNPLLNSPIYTTLMSRNQQKSSDSVGDNSLSDESFTSADNADDSTLVLDESENSDSSVASTSSVVKRLPARERNPPKRYGFTYISTASTSVNDSELSLEEALNGPEKEHWLRAVQAELQCFEDNKAWELADAPLDGTIVKLLLNVNIADMTLVVRHVVIWANRHAASAALPTSQTRSSIAALPGAVYCAQVSEVRDLGVIIDNKLTSSSHLNTAAKKEAQMLGFIKRNTKEFRLIRTNFFLYNSLVQSHLEFASEVWSPIYAVQSQRIESVQRAFTSHLAYISSGISHRVPFYQRLNYFRMNTLHNHSKIHDILILHKLLNGTADCSELSPCLARKLKSLGFDCMGILRTDRKFVPQALNSLTKRNMRQGQITGPPQGTRCHGMEKYQ